MSMLTMFVIADFFLFAIGGIIAGVKGLTAIEWLILFMIVNILAIPIVIFHRDEY